MTDLTPRERWESVRYRRRLWRTEPASAKPLLLPSVARPSVCRSACVRIQRLDRWLMEDLGPLCLESPYGAQLCGSARFGEEQPFQRSRTQLLLPRLK